MAKEIVAMILAGGRGSRLYALTQKTAKPAVSFGGKYRIVDFPLSNCVNSKPVSSNTSLATVSSIVSPISVKPAISAYLLYSLSAYFVNNILSLSVTPTITAGAILGNT